MANQDHIINANDLPEGLEDVQQTAQTFREPAETAHPSALVFDRERAPAFFSGSMPPQFQLDANFARARGHSPNVPTSSLMPFALNANPSTNAAIQSTAQRTVVVSGGSSVDTDNTVLDGITHGTVPWWTDPGFVYYREDFLGGPLPTIWPGTAGSTGTSIGYAGDWVCFGSVRNRTPQGGAPPHAGIFEWSQQDLPGSGFGGIMLNTSGDVAGATNITYRTMALLENPGWKASWVFQFSGQASNGSGIGPDWSKKAFYCGFTGPGIAAIRPNNTTMGLGQSSRPDCFFGLRYDTSHTPESWGLSQVGAGGGGVTVYTPHNGTTGGLYLSGVNTYLNSTIVVTGCANPNNNGTFTCTASTATTITLNNPNGVVDNAVSSSAVIRPTKLNIVAVTAGSPVAGKTKYSYPTHVNAAGGNIHAGANGGYVGQVVTITGCTNANNNGTFTVLGSGINGANTEFIVTNAGTTEVPAANTAFVSFTDPINDFGGNFKFEYVNNPQWSVSQARHNVAGTVVDTGIAPKFSRWYRLDMVCSAVGVVVISLLDETAGTTVSSTYTIPKQTVVTPSNLNWSTDNNNQRTIIISSDGGGVSVVSAVSFPQFLGYESLITISGLTGGNAVANGTWKLYPSSSAGLSWVGTINLPSPIGFSLQSATIVGYPSFTPIVIWGADDSGGNSSFPDSSEFGIDLYTFVWNPNLGPNAPGTPNALKSRYW